MSFERFAVAITTAETWEDLALDDVTRRQVEEIATWVEHGRPLGKPILIHGPRACRVAAMIGKTTGRPVYRIDLVAVVSKYIGETEKNLDMIFGHEGCANWLLFFDEAGALLGTRDDANDRAANQQLAYLLQRIEDFPGVVILATNLRSHLDEAFARRFQSVIVPR